jgi:hypothetical protein
VRHVRQLVVRHRALDPTAWTALTALRAKPGPLAPSALARADLWEFEWEGAAALEEPLAEWAREANGFANPNRDRATWRQAAGDATDLEAGAALASGESGAKGPGAFLVTTWRGDVCSTEHEAAAARALGVAMRVRRAQVWWLSCEVGDPKAALAAAGGGPSGGLLANPHSQAASLYGDTLPVPAIEDHGERGRTR